MGFFSRQDTTAPQGSAQQQEQLIELRRRARRRLVGALVLVLIAVIFVPLFLNNDGAEEIEQVVQVFPPIVAPEKAPEIEPVPWQDDKDESEASEPEVVDELAEPDDIEDLIGQQVAAIEAQRAEEGRSEPETTEPEPKPEPKPESRPAEPERTDDGSVALALLEGRMPPEEGDSGNAQPAASGNFTVQVAAYSTKEGADERRQQLSSAGVNNAFVETGSGSNGTTYRLRVGPFETRQAAEAALTRLRSLGYEDSFIRSQ